ncbi:structural maintenance of chromosomes 5 smc5 [Dorcoceras hygrometricum]|uniref:Structural maintenance of chromosomes 5 smc5 n=1 Tax=Dorcoceras hygrometricum TaxID=472368 RepID=A0A2Z7AK02_9LAMI|nr:structural maintenance of chromosomes 5 smc5 [Dorcoceras hygrometricum]
MYTFTPRTPERSPNLASFLDAMCDKSYNAPELIKEDLLCLFGFSRKGVELVRDLDEHMGKAAMLKAWDEAEEGSSRATVPPKKATNKRKASTPTEKEARCQKKKGASSSGARSVLE